jgi:hypothetical protein
VSAFGGFRLAFRRLAAGELRIAKARADKLSVRAAPLPPRRPMEWLCSRSRLPDSSKADLWGLLHVGTYARFRSRDCGRLDDATAPIVL